MGGGREAFGSSLSEEYEPPFKFTGVLSSVIVKLLP